MRSGRGLVVGFMVLVFLGGFWAMALLDYRLRQAIEQAHLNPAPVADLDLRQAP